MKLLNKIFGKSTKNKIQQVESINPNDLLFIIPTISNEFPQATVGASKTYLDVDLHEDDYRQNEFLPRYSMPLIKKEISEIKDVLEKYNSQNENFTAFRKCHVRRLIGKPALGIRLTELISFLKGSDIGTVNVNSYILKDSFAFKTDNTTFYGISDNEIISELCILKWNANTIDEINQINSKFNLVFVNWCNAEIIQENE